MTAEDQKNQNNLPVIVEVEVVPQESPFYSLARAVLSAEDLQLLRDYKESGKPRISPKVTSGFFELFLNGSSTKEIHQLNNTMPYGGILWARVDEKWDIQREEYIRDLTLGIREKMLKAQTETAGLLTDMLTAANKQHGVKIKKFIQTGDEKDLGNAMSITSIQSLMKVVEGLQKLTGQDKTIKIKSEETINHNVTVTTTDTGMSAESAAQILAVVAEDKRRKQSEKLPK